MDRIVILIVGILFASFTSILTSWFKANLNCPKPKVLYRNIPKHTLDVQFGEENLPSSMFKTMFIDLDAFSKNKFLYLNNK